MEEREKIERDIYRGREDGKRSPGPWGCFWMGEQFQRVNGLQVSDCQAIKDHSVAQTGKKEFGKMISC